MVIFSIDGVPTCRSSVHAPRNSRPEKGRYRCSACSLRYSSVGITNAGRLGLVLAQKTVLVHDPDRKRAATARSDHAAIDQSTSVASRSSYPDCHPHPYSHQIAAYSLAIPYLYPGCLLRTTLLPAYPHTAGSSPP